MKPATPTPDAPTPDPYRYGWRDVLVTRPDGSQDLERVPLTLEDVLHPQLGDVMPQRSIHELDCGYLADVFRSRSFGPPFTRVTADLLIDWGVPDMRPHSPDVAVFAGLRQEPDLREGTFHLASSGGRCLLVVEVISPDTRDNDVKTKVLHYHSAGVPLYLIVDQQYEDGPRWLVAYRWHPSGFQRAELDERGRFLIAPLGLLMQVRDDRVVCYDAATGRELGDYVRLARELEEADRRNQEQERALEESIESFHKESRARQDAEKKASDAEKKAQAEAKARADAEKKVRAETRARAAAVKKAEAEARARANAEKQASDARELARAEADRATRVEERLRELEAALHRLQGNAPPGTV